jgi:hypothetical protein
MELEYRFKICTTTEEYIRALDSLEKISENITEVSFNDIELINRLKKGLTRQYKRYIQRVKNQELKDSAKGQFKQVLDNFTESIYKEGIAVFERFIKCINLLFYKTKDEKILAVLYSIRAALFSFMVQHSSDKSKYLELALTNYKKAVDICMKYLNSLDVIRLRVFHGYIKFIFTQVRDKYRSILFCINVLEEINQVKETMYDKYEEFLTSEEFLKMETKFRKFYDNNIEEYNKVIGLYHPEYKDI